MTFFLIDRLDEKVVCIFLVSKSISEASLVMGHLLRICEVLNSNPSAEKRKEKKNKNFRSGYNTVNTL